MSMDDMLYDAARDAAAEKADEVRDELLGEVRDLEGRIDAHDSRLDDIDSLRLDEFMDNVDERLTAHPTHDDLDHQIDRINALERNLGFFDNVADCNQIADLNVRVNDLSRSLDEVTRIFRADIDRLRRVELAGAEQAHGNRLQALEDAVYDTAGSASRQHFIDTGRYLTHAEVAEDDERPDVSWARPMNTEQRRTIFGLLKGLGWTNDPTYGSNSRQRRISVVQAILNRVQPHQSFTTLSEAEADDVIAALLQANRIKEALA